jgi:hypothetical protein
MLCSLKHHDAPIFSEGKLSEPIEVHDGLNHWRCPQLGGPVPFKHCRRAGFDSLPCRKLPDCWNSTIDVAAFVSEVYTQEEIQHAFGTEAKSRLDIILETIKKTGGNSDKSEE